MKLVDQCRSKLIKVAQSGCLITYGELAEHLGVFNQGLGPYLKEIHSAEVNSGHPDLTVVVVYSDTRCGRYYLKNGDAEGVKIDPQSSDPDHVRRYLEEVTLVHEHKDWENSRDV